MKHTGLMSVAVATAIMIGGCSKTEATKTEGTRRPDVKVRPDKSNTDIGTKINQWAAETYPVAQKHLDTARALENATKKRSTN